VYGQNGIAGIVRVEKESPQLSRLKFLFKIPNCPIQVIQDFFSFLSQLQQDFYFFFLISQ
jgi:hypothetical protein